MTYNTRETSPLNLHQLNFENELRKRQNRAWIANNSSALAQIFLMPMLLAFLFTDRLFELLVVLTVTFIFQYYRYVSQINTIDSVNVKYKNYRSAVSTNRVTISLLTLSIFLLSQLLFEIGRPLVFLSVLLFVIIIVLKAPLWVHSEWLLRQQKEVTHQSSGPQT